MYEVGMIDNHPVLSYEAAQEVGARALAYYEEHGFLPPTVVYGDTTS